MMIWDVLINHKLLSKFIIHSFLGGHFGYENTQVGKSDEPRIVPTSSDFIQLGRSRKLAFGMSEKSDFRFIPSNAAAQCRETVRCKSVRFDQNQFAYGDVLKYGWMCLNNGGTVWFMHVEEQCLNTQTFVVLYLL